MKLTIIIPAHNEEEVLEKTVVSIIDYLKTKDYEILICNDHSTDKTLELAKKLSKKHKQVRYTSNTNDAGFGNALLFGFSQAKSDLVLPMMADLCDDPRTIPLMLEKIDEGYDIVCGSRYMKGGKKIGENAFKDFFSRLIGRICRYIIGIKTLDITNAFKMYRKSIFKNITVEKRDFSISMEIPLKAYFKGYRITEVPTAWTTRKVGKSKFNVPKVAPSYFKIFLWALGKKIHL
jgi:dolichol-phosphate mannosyltransferase